MRMAAICTCLLAALANSSRGDELLTLEQILARHNATLETLRRCTVKTTERWAMTRADGSPEQLLSERNCDIRIDQARANLLVDEMNYLPVVNANEFNYVCDEQVLQIFYPHDKIEVRPPVPQVVHGRLSPQADDEFYVESALGNAAIAFGLTTFLSPIPIAKLITLSKNEPVTKDELGYHVEGTAPDGTRHKICFDPSAGFIVRSLIFEQSGETLNDNRFQYNRRVLTSRYGFADKALVNSVTFEIQDVQTLPWKETFVITALKTKKTISATDGTKAVETTNHTLTDWNLNPDFSDKASFRPRLPVPEGTHVLVRDTPSLEYVYKDGLIQLAINQPTLTSLEKTQISHRPSTPRMQWTWALVAGVLGFAWWKMRMGAG